LPFRIRLEGGSGRKTIVTRRQLTDGQWKLIEPFLPIGEYGPYPERLRDQFEGVIWRFRTSSQWREMPGEFGPWPTVYGPRRKLRLKQALLGRSRGGLTSKVHLAADRRCRPLSFVLTAGQAADSTQFVPVLQKVRIRLPVGRPRTRPDAVAADKAYSSRANRSYLRKRNIKAVIPEKRDQAANRKKKGSRGGRPTRHDADLYKERNTVERLINKLKAWRGIATRYDKTPESYLAGLHLRASMIWINDLLKATD
jgi:transposase